tara:strand:- start:354 stop:521 length:168 start_codon:yes stop_codon:yes gene_type:complete
MMRKDYIRFANEIAKIKDSEKRSFLTEFVGDIFKDDNPKFDYKRFWNKINGVDKK